MRYAIYFTPPEHDALTRKASQWLGRDAFTNIHYSDDPADADITAEPRRYGFHATLKAPFELSEQHCEADLLAALRAFAETRNAFDIPKIVVGALGPFFALVPERNHPPLQDFAADIVRHFKPFHAPLTERDIARRKPEKLTQSQRHNLAEWGYPYVMDDFRFHMTLTGPVKSESAEETAILLKREFAEFTERPLTVSGLGLFIEEERGEPFTVHTWLPLNGPDTKVVQA